MSTPTARLAMVTLDCADAEASAAFWSGMLGWDVAHSERDYAMLTGPDHALGAPERQVEIVDAPRGRVGGVAFVLALAEEDQFEAVAVTVTGV